MVIKLFDKDDNKHIFNVSKPIGTGSTGNVFRINEDTCLKYIQAYSMYDCSIIEKIMELDLDNFYKIYQLLFDNNGCFSGYLMKYYESEDVNPLLMPTEYTLENFNKISKSMKILNDNVIVARDIHSGNAIMDKNKITVIDVDFFDFEYGMDEVKIKRNNYNSLMSLFLDIYKEGLYIYDGDMYDVTRVLLNLFSPREEEKMIYEKLRGYKYPIDYIKSRVKKKQ